MMQSTAKNVTQRAALETIYKNVKMGVNGIINLLPYVREGDLRSAMTAQLDGYEKYAAQVRALLEQEGGVPKEAAGERLVAKMGAAWRGMLGITRTELAKMLIEHSNACITEMTHLLNHIEKSRCEGARLARELVDFEARNVEALKQYL